ncbi:MAG: hypothetical protein WA181_07615, partial [Bacillus mycoides]
VKRIGVQVTTEKTSKKINQTLKKITADQIKKYDRFLIVILGKKQEKYSIDGALAKKLKWSERDIIDIYDIEKEILSLKPLKMKEVYKFLDESLIKFYGELGFDSTPSGEDTSLLSSVEIVPATTFVNCNKIALVQKEKYDSTMDPTQMQEVNEASRKLFEILKRLPRITREFYYVVVSRSEWHKIAGAYYARDEIIKRVIRIPEDRYYEEISMLQEVHILNLCEEDVYHKSLMLDGYCKAADCLYYIIEAANHYDLSLKEILVELKFSLLAADTEEVQ